MELCDDDFKFRDCCKSGGSDPEWPNIVRGLLGSKQWVRIAAGSENWELY
jgi:hypothetical protein